ncbi:MAG TPA: DUF4845 domain-containing protein [Mariprofundaceae bacterium]|nr:DUF4845 domain-containing protein [Mariprofundaceae bacterium]
MRKQAGFSMIKLMFWLALLAGGVWYGYNVIPVYNTYWNVKDVFKSISRDMASDNEATIRERLPDIMHVKYIAHEDLPPAFYKNLEIKADGNRVDISSYYHVTVWLLGPVQGVDSSSPYDKKDLKGMDRLRDKARLDFDFEPHAETP